MLVFRLNSIYVIGYLGWGRDGGVQEAVVIVPNAED